MAFKLNIDAPRVRVDVDAPKIPRTPVIGNTPNGRVRVNTPRVRANTLVPRELIDRFITAAKQAGWSKDQIGEALSSVMHRDGKVVRFNEGKSAADLQDLMKSIKPKTPTDPNRVTASPTGYTPATPANRPTTPPGVPVDDLTNPNNRVTNPPVNNPQSPVGRRGVDPGANGNNTGKFRTGGWPKNKSNVPEAEILPDTDYYNPGYEFIKDMKGLGRGAKRVAKRYTGWAKKHPWKAGLGAGATALLVGNQVYNRVTKPYLIDPLAQAVNGLDAGVKAAAREDKDPSWKPLPQVPLEPDTKPDYSSGWWKAGGMLGGAILAPWIVSSLMPKDSKGGILDTLLTLAAIGGGAYGGYKLGEWGHKQWGQS